MPSISTDISRTISPSVLIASAPSWISSSISREGSDRDEYPCSIKGLDGGRAGLAGARAVSAGWILPDSQPQYWFLRVRFDGDKSSASKDQFCRALAAVLHKVDAAYAR